MRRFRADKGDRRLPVFVEQSERSVLPYLVDLTTRFERSIFIGRKIKNHSLRRFG